MSRLVASSHDPGEVFVSALEAHGCVWKGHPHKGMAQCPAHEDRDPSLTFEEGSDGRLLVWCWAGCETADVVAALGLRMGDLFPSDHRLAPQSRQSKVQRERPLVSMLALAQAAGISWHATLNPSMYALDRCPVCNGEALWLHDDGQDAVRVSCPNGCDRNRIVEALSRKPERQGQETDNALDSG